MTKTVQTSLSRTDQDIIDDIVPPALQKPRDDSNNLIEFEEGGLSQSNFLEEIELRHPMLKAKHRLDSRYVPRSYAKNPWKPERQDSQTVNIEGEKKPWGQFKREFTEDLLEKTSRGEVTKNASFVLNFGEAKEKLMLWNYKTGFRSEDSDDEMTLFKRTER